MVRDAGNDGELYSTRVEELMRGIGQTAVSTPHLADKK